MSAFQLIGLVVSLVAFFGYLNHRFVKLPDTVGITAIGVVVSLAAVLVANHDPGIARSVAEAIAHFDFASLLLNGVLGLLLFAGSLHINAGDIAKEKWLILVLATFGVATSTVLVGAGFYVATGALGMAIPLLSCMLFGALISPTDPVAVLAVLRRVGVPKGLETRIAGESLFNDGTGVVVFLTLLALTQGPAHLNAASAVLLFATEVLGGVVFGLAAGQIGFLMLRRVDSHPVEILITLALATGGYTLAEALHVSAPIAVVLMGLIVGSRGKHEAMSPETQRRLFEFWDVLDDLLNLLLFGLIGLEMLILTFSATHIALAALAIVIVLAARFVSIGLPIFVAPRLGLHRRAAITIMTWGGLRGGISIALALSLPMIAGRETIITTTYGVVIFSILVQALSLRRVAARALAAD
ncbi:MAG TPA: sodium:proton antiporter [Caldimonas sp.]|nr:sodium:proton antiporter [Caldimonas sp.]HEX4233939.1 sodium:proton antiporter [Caldimonas sp.]